jgi:serine protease Do
MQLKSLLSFAVVIVLASPLHAAARHEQFAERSRSLVFVEYFIQREVDRQTSEGVGLVISEDGLIVCLPNIFPDWVPPSWYRSIKVFPAENPTEEGLPATYLGQDWVNGWHYIRMDDAAAAAEHLTPITDFGSGVPKIGETVWGICLTTGELDYIPYYREAKLSTIQPLPMRTAFATSEVAVPGGAVFLEDGRFAGWAGRSLPMERDMWIGSEFFRANIRNPDETHMFLLAEEFLGEAFARIPTDPLEHNRPWIGISGTQPLDKETARFMGLVDQGAVIISEVLPDTPADRAGLQDRDLVIAVNNRPIPRLKPDSVVQVYLERELLLSPIGEPLSLTVLRGQAEAEIELVPARSPTLMKEAERTYFEAIGLTLRQYIVADALQRREDHRLLKGAVVNFIRPNSPAAAGGVEPGDWVLEIGGQPVGDFTEATDRMQAMIEDAAREEVVLLVRRGNETSVLRIRKGNE